MHSVYHFYLVNQPNFVFIIFKISCSCALYSLHLECNLSPHLVIKIIIYIQSNFFRRYILISMIPILTNTNNTISMVFQIISAKKTILAKLLHLLTGFIGEIRNQVSIYICISQFHIPMTSLSFKLLSVTEPTVHVTSLLQIFLSILF